MCHLKHTECVVPQSFLEAVFLGVGGGGEVKWLGEEASLLFPLFAWCYVGALQAKDFTSEISNFRKTGDNAKAGMYVHCT